MVEALRGDFDSRTELASSASEILEEDGERRTAPRFTMLIRGAKLCWKNREYLCIIKDVSETGVSLRVFHEMPAIEAVELELGNGERDAAGNRIGSDRQ